MTPESNYSRFIIAATMFIDALENGGRYSSNARVYRAISFLRKRYNVSRELENDVINGFIRARNGAHEEQSNVQS